jgi:WD40 repeat protein
VAFGPDGKTLASCGFDDDARVWDVETGKVLATVEADNPILSVALTANGKTLATASARWGNGFYSGSPAQVQTWDVATGKLLVTLPQQPAQVFSMIFTLDGKSLFTASLSGAVTLWDLAKFPIVKEAPKPAEPATR